MEKPVEKVKPRGKEEFDVITRTTNRESRFRKVLDKANEGFLLKAE